MRWVVGLFIVLLTGCQGLSLLESPGETDPQRIMSLWERYQRCRAATDPIELSYIVQQFEAVMVSGVEPPSWLKGWGHHVRSQPIRTAIDPQVLGAACTLRAAAAMVQTDQVADARLLYERVVLRYSSADWIYYSGRARKALDRLAESRPALAASVPLRLPTLDR